MSPAPPGPRRRARAAAQVAGTEAAFDRAVDGLARFYHWRSYHTHDSRRSTAGYPDRTYVKGPRLIFAELKAKSAEEARKSAGARTTRAALEARPEWLRYFDVSDAQAAWLEDLAGVGAAVALELDERDARGRHGNYAGTLPPRDPSVEVYLWRPEDLERIAHVFAGVDGNLDAGVAFARDHAPTTTPGGPA